MAASSAPGFVQDLALVLSVAGATSLVVRKLGQPAILGYLLAGLVVGPYVPIPLFADATRVQELSDFGVVLVMFAIGLEFRVATLLRVLPRAGLAALFSIGLLGWCGINLATLFGWSSLEGLLLGGSMAISSTMVLKKTLEDVPLDKATEGLVVGVLVLQDIVAIGLLASFSGLKPGGTPSWIELGWIEAQVVFFLIALATGGMFLVPALIRAASGPRSEEAILVVATGTAFAFAEIAAHFGYSPALGAFVAGVLVAESGERRAVEHGVHPLKNLFGAVFFVSVGMAVDPLLVSQSLGKVLTVSAVVVLAQLMGTGVGALLSGGSLSQAVTSGLALGQMGEFSFLIVATGIQAGLAGDEFRPVVVGAAVLTAFTTPLLLRRAEALTRGVDRVLPAPLRTALSVYQARLERAQSAPQAPRSQLWKIASALALDGILLIGGGVGFLIWRNSKAPLAFHPGTQLGAFLLALPLVLAYIRNTQAFAAQIIAATNFEGEGTFPREAGSKITRLGVFTASFLALGIPAAAWMRPLLPGPYVATGIGLGVLYFGYRISHRSQALRQEVLTGASELIQRVAARGHQDRESPGGHSNELTPLGTFSSFEVPEGSWCLGRSLLELGIRAHSGALVLALERGGEVQAPPPPDVPLQARDRLALLGGEEATGKALAFLNSPPSKSS